MNSVRQIFENQAILFSELLLKNHSPAFDWDVSKLREELIANQGYALFSEQQVPISVAVIADRIAGIELTLLATSVDHQKQGNMNHLISWLIASKCQGRDVWLEVHESNLSARNLYQKIGFREVGTRPKYYRDGGSAILMTLFAAN